LLSFPICSSRDDGGDAIGNDLTTSTPKYKRSPLEAARFTSKHHRRSRKVILPSFWTLRGFQIGSCRNLIGLLICEHGRATQHSLWAETAEDEESIWKKFVQKVSEYPNAPIYHYGSYEVRVIESFIKRFGPDSASIRKRLVNINSQVYGRVYFPIHSNSLKVLGKFLGASWTEPDAFGLQSIVWRHRWETGGEAQYKKSSFLTMPKTARPCGS